MDFINSNDYFIIKILEAMPNGHQGEVSSKSIQLLGLITEDQKKLLNLLYNEPYTEYPDGVKMNMYLEDNLQRGDGNRVLGLIKNFKDKYSVYTQKVTRIATVESLHTFPSLSGKIIESKLPKDGWLHLFPGIFALWKGANDYTTGNSSNTYFISKTKLKTDFAQLEEINALKNCTLISDIIGKYIQAYEEYNRYLPEIIIQMENLERSSGGSKKKSKRRSKKSKKSRKKY